MLCLIDQNSIECIELEAVLGLQLFLFDSDYLDAREERPGYPIVWGILSLISLGDAAGVVWAIFAQFTGNSSMYSGGSLSEQNEFKSAKAMDFVLS